MKYYIKRKEVKFEVKLSGERAVIAELTKVRKEMWCYIDTLKAMYGELTVGKDTRTLFVYAGELKGEGIILDWSDYLHKPGRETAYFEYQALDLLHIIEANSNNIFNKQPLDNDTLTRLIERVTRLKKYCEDVINDLDEVKGELLKIRDEKDALERMKSINESSSKLN